jgi:hypothetical protein
MNKPTPRSWVYLRSEPNLWTVGFYAPDGKWNPESDYNIQEEAARRVVWLNGGAVAEGMAELVKAAKTIYFKIAMIPVDWKNPEAKELSAQAVDAIDALRAALAKLEIKP